MSDPIRHLSDERIQEWLDGQIPAGEIAQIQSHLDGCIRCRAEAEGWRALVAGLSSLAALAPTSGFAGRVLDAVGRSAPERESLAARIGARLLDWVADDAAAAHPGPGGLQDFIEGALSGRQATRVRSHLAACETCRHEAKGWGALLHELAALPHLAPSPAFVPSIMARVRMPAPVRVALARRALDRVRALAGPRYRRAWAAAAGVALTPAVAGSLVAYAIFSHPLVTVGNLVSFLWLKGTAAAGAFGNGAVNGLVQSAALFRAWTALDTLVSSPAAAGAGLLAFSVLTLAAIWVLYRNLFTASTAHAYAKAA